VVETIEKADAEELKHWLFFCASVDHAHHIRDLLREYGVTAETVTGKTPKAKREEILDRYKSGEIQALTNVDVLTTGFDYPEIDLIVFLRPTESPGLYLQMAGRGMRLKSHKKYCRVLDFAGLVRFHGPVTAIEPPSAKGEGGGEAPVKACPECKELVHASVKVCPECGAEFPPPPPKPVRLYNDDIMGKDPAELPIVSWHWEKNVSRTSGKEMLKVKYSGLVQKIDEYFPVTHGGFAGQKAVEKIAKIAISSGADWKSITNIDMAPDAFNKGNPPDEIVFKKSGKFYDIIERRWKSGEV
jgi:DNA repair protein RadD